MKNDSFYRRYLQLMRGYLRSGEERYLMQAADLGRDLTEAETPPEEMTEMHQEVLGQLAEEMPDLTLRECAERIPAPLTELLMSHSLLFREQAERRRLQRELNKLSHAVEHSPSVVALTDPEARIDYVNPRFTEITGYAAEKVVGRSIHEFFFAELDAEAFHYLWAEMIARGEWRGEYRSRRKDGETFWGDIALSQVGEEPEHFVLVMEDVTERKLAWEKLQRTNRELENFVSSVSHDLRTSLTPIIGMAELLQSSYADSLDDAGLSCLTRIREKGLSMVDLMEDLLTLARADKLERPTEPQSAEIAAREVVLEVAEISRSGLKIDFGPLPPARVPKSLLSQIFRNLIGNAVVYAGPDGGPVEVWGEEDDGRVHYLVRDHGPGIPEAERERIFEMFERGSAGKSHSGTGLGLAIVQKVARIFDGSVRVEQTPGGGSTFVVEMAA